MVEKHSLTIVAAALFVALSSAAVAQTASQRTDASQAGQTSPTKVVSPSGGATAGAGGTASGAAGAVGSIVDTDDGPGKKGKGKAKGHRDDGDRRGLSSQRD